MPHRKTNLSAMNFNNKSNVGEQIKPEEKVYNVFYVYKSNNFFNKIFGLQKISYDDDTPKTLSKVAKAYATIFVCLVIVESYFLINDLKERVGVLPIIVVMDILSNICVTTTAIVSVLVSAFLIPPFILRGLKGFGSIDEKLGIKGKDNYVYLRNRIIIAQILLTIISVLHLFYELYVGVEQWSVNYRAITMHFIDMGVYVQWLDFATLIWIIVTRFKLFNSQLSELIVEDENELEIHKQIEQMNQVSNQVGDSDTFGTYKSYDQIKIQKDLPEKLTKLMKVFDELADVSNIIGSSFGLSILFSSTTAFLYIISTVNGLIMFDDLIKEDSNHTIPYIIGWSLPDIIYLVTAAYFSEMLKNEVERTNNYIDKLSINTEPGTTNSEIIENFVQLLSVREVFVTASNFFPFDMTFVLSLAGAVATYTVLLMQVKPQKSIAVSNSTLIGNFTNNFTNGTV